MIAQSNLTWGFEYPQWLWLLLGLPVIWWFGFDVLRRLGQWRRWLALGLRTLVFLLLVLSLARFQTKQATDRMTVFFLLDQSESIPVESRRFMLDYAASAVARHRHADQGDLAGVIVFGQDARIEVAPYDGDLPLIGRLESANSLRFDATNLEAALKIAKASFLEGTSRRVVIISDGNENLGNARRLARSLGREGIGIDVIPVKLLARSEISVLQVDLPSDVRLRQEFDARVVLNYETGTTPVDPTATTTGKLRLIQRVGVLDPNSVSDQEQEITLRPGKNVFSFRQNLVQPGLHSLRAVFTPNANDLNPKNNESTAFTHLRGKASVLFIEDRDDAGSFGTLIDRLRKNEIEVDITTTDKLFSSLAELVTYDCIVLANVSRTSDSLSGSIDEFTDEQIKQLVRNTEELGCGLLMLGGDRSFGVGGWTGTELEKALPVDLQIDNDKVRATGAIVLVMHASEIARANFWQQMVVLETIKLLGGSDYCGVVDWQPQGCAWLWRIPNGVDRVGPNRPFMLTQVRKLQPGDMPDFEPSMKMALNGLTSGRIAPSVRHMVIVSDGDPTPPGAQIVQAFIDNKIPISTVAIGAHTMPMTMQDVAAKTGGKFYNVPDADGAALPKIIQRETRRVAKPLIRENPNGIGVGIPSTSAIHPVLAGIESSELAPITGYVLTTKKKHPLVETLLEAAVSEAEREHGTIAAVWQYGAGRTAAITTDAGQKWASAWVEAAYFDKLYTQLIQYLMRPVGSSGDFLVSTEVDQGRTRAVVTAMNSEGESLDFLDLKARGVNPDNNGFDIRFKQIAPGRYAADFPSERAGNYLFSIFPGKDYSPVLAGVTIPTAAEYSDRQTNVSLLTELSALEPAGGQAGQLVASEFGPATLQDLLKFDPYRRSLQTNFLISDLWPLLLLCFGLLFATDVAVRRIVLSWAWVGVLASQVAARLSGRTAAGVAAQKSLARLQARKAEVRKQFAPESSATSTGDISQSSAKESSSGSGAEQLDSVMQQHAPTIREPRVPRTVESADVDDKTFTSKLLDAKRKSQRHQSGTSDDSP